MNIRELQHNVNLLYQTGGQAAMESALAAWYLNQASAASSQRSLDDAIRKAHSLDPENTFYWLAARHHGSNDFDEATQYYLKAFAANPSRRSCWPMIGEYLLRYGRSETVVDFYSRVLSMDGGNDFARFVLQCHNYFESLQQEIGTRIHLADHQRSGSKKLLAQVVFWGARYTDIFLNYLLPALFAPGNLPAVCQDYQIHFIICTDAQGADRLQWDVGFAKLKNYLVPHVITYSPVLFDYAADFSRKHGGKWTIPVTLLTNAAHYAVLECGRRLERPVLNFSPDHILSERFLTEMAAALSDKVQVLAGPGFRLYYAPHLLEEINARYRKPSGTLDISPPEMVRLLINHLPEPNFVHAEQFSAYPIYLCWQVKGEGIIAHVNHYHPWVVRGDGLAGPVQLSLDPIDGNFLNRCLANQQAIAFAPQAMLSFDLGTNPLCLPADNNRFSVRKVAQWVRPFLSPVHEHYFQNSLFYRSGSPEPSQDWRRTADQARTVVKEIIAHAKNV